MCSTEVFAVLRSSGPLIARAPNDVGGLLDTTKGWTLNIPMPNETSSATAAVANQQAPAKSEKPVVGAVLAAR